MNAANAGDTGRKVVVFRSNVLAYSETFIREQVLACRRWRAVLLGRQRVAGMALDDVPFRTLYPAAPGRLAGKALKLLRELGLPPPGLVALLRRQRPDLVHVHFGTDVVEEWPALSRLRVPIVVTLHGYDINTAKRVWRQGGLASRQYPERLVAIARQPHVHFVAVSDAIRRRALEYGIPGDRLVVRYIGVDTARFQPAGAPVERRTPRVLFVGRFVEKKGARYLLEAFVRVQRDVPAAELVLIGDGPLRDELKRQAAALGLRALFRGSLPPAEVAQELHRSRALCLPSVTAADGDAEGLGMVLLEAQACGVPVVSSARGGAAEALVDGRTGFAFAERDSETLAARLARLLTDAPLAATMGREARELMVAKWNLRACTSALEAHYDDVVAGVPAAGWQPQRQPQTMERRHA